MTGMYRELVLGGILVTPVVRDIVIAFAAFLLVRPLLHSIGFANFFSNPSIAELSVFVGIFGILAISF